MRKSKYTKEILEEAVKQSESIMGVMRILGIKMAGGAHSHIKNRIKQLDIDTSHFTGQGHLRGKHSSNKKMPEDIFVILPQGSRRMPASQLRRAMIESGIMYQCVLCGIQDKWAGKPITLEVDHIDGNWYNNLSKNLRFLCPNCHSQCDDTNKSWRK